MTSASVSPGWTVGKPVSCIRSCAMISDACEAGIRHEGAAVVGPDYTEQVLLRVDDEDRVVRVLDELGDHVHQPGPRGHRHHVGSHRVADRKVAQQAHIAAAVDVHATAQEA